MFRYLWGARNASRVIELPERLWDGCFDHVPEEAVTVLHLDMFVFRCRAIMDTRLPFMAGQKQLRCRLSEGKDELLARFMAMKW